MKKINKLFFLLTLMLVGFIGMNGVDAEDYGLWVNGEQFTSEKTTINCDSGTAVFDNSTNTLTLNNAKITNTVYKKGSADFANTYSSIYTMNDGLKINLVGNNYIDIPGNINFWPNDVAGIVAPEVEFNGSGSLDIGFEIKTLEELNEKANKGHWISGILVKDNNSVTINSGNLTVSGLFDIAIEGLLNTKNYDNSHIMVSGRWDFYSYEHINYELYTDSEYNKECVIDSNVLCENIKIGNYDIYKIDITSSYDEPLIDMVSDVIYAFEGELLALESYGWDDLEYPTYINNIEIRNTGTDAIITNDLLEDYGDYYIMRMPNYNLTAYMDYEANYSETVNGYVTKLYGYNDVKLTWTREDHAKGYYIYYKKANDSKWSSFRVNNCSDSLTKCTYKKANLKNGYKYVFKVVPYTTVSGEILKSTKSKSSTIYTLKKLNTPKVTKKSKTKVKIKWNKINGATKYQIARSTSKTKGFKIIRNAKSTSSSYVVKATKGKRYYYKVRACNGNVCAPWSNVKAYKLS